VRRVARLVVLATAAWVVAAPAVLAQERAMDPLLKLLVKKGVVSQAEAEALQAEYAAMKRRAAARQEAVATAVARREAEKVVAEAPAPKLELPKALRGLKIGMLAYLSYQDGRRYEGVPGDTAHFSRFTLKRGYLNVTKEISPHLEARLTPDVHQDSTGDWKARFKYLYGKLKWRGRGILQKPYVEFGLAHMPWLDFEEHVNRFRMQDTMFMERSGLFNSADVGVMFGGNLGGELPALYRKNVNGHYAGRYGSFQVGLYNGTGYHAGEKNTNKVLEARISLRPLPAAAPGLQLSLFGLSGKGNTEAEPDWDVFTTMVSWESPRLVLTGQYVTGTGNQQGTAVDANGRSLDRDGYSAFAELRLGARRDFSLIGRYDHFDPDTDDPASDRQDRWVAGLAWQFIEGNYWLLDFQTVQHDNPAIPDENRVQLTLQVKY